VPSWCARPSICCSPASPARDWCIRQAHEGHGRSRTDVWTPVISKTQYENLPFVNNHLDLS
jgi:hypothetical protein